MQAEVFQTQVVQEQTNQKVADGESNLVVAPTEGGNPIFFTPNQ